MSEYLFAVQDAEGREVCSVKAEVDKVSAVSAEMRPGGVAIVRQVSGDDKVGLGGAIATGDTDKAAEELSLLRWPADDKLSDPVRKAITTDN